jgi:hypothetical protein
MAFVPPLEIGRFPLVSRQLQPYHFTGCYPQSRTRD